eukprot:m.447071 g.447071  ORF g.447071 m.447071 type:complete len:121 (-) comp19466_c0_seq1:2941-3303(-)
MWRLTRLPVSRHRAVKRRLSAPPRDSPFPPEVEKELNTPIVFESHPKTVKYGTLGLTTVLTVWAVMILDFGEKDHCFTPLRRWFHKQRDTLWAPAPEEVEMLKKIESDLKLGGPAGEGKL